MRIGIDVTIFIDGNFTGIPRSVHEILRVWREKETEHEFFLLSNKPIKLEFDLPENWHMVVSSWIVKKGRLWKWFQLPKEIVNLKLDAFWGTGYYLPRRVRKTKYYVTVYDLALFLFKSIGDPKCERNIKIDTRNACHRADKIIAISKATANDIQRIFGMPEKKIEMSYCGGISHNYFVNQCEKPDNQSLYFPEKYFLFLSTIEPRKNIRTIIKAFELYMDKTGNRTKLVLAGKKGWRCDDVYEAIEHSKWKDLIVMPGYVSDNDKGYLLSHAEAFLYPSLYEGFGIPILEAFAYGLPVITTNYSAMPEVAGDAGFYIEKPDDAVGLASQMHKIHSLSREKKELLEKKMTEQLRKFTWEKNADEMMHIIKKGAVGNE